MVTTQTADSILKSYYLGTVSDLLDKTANPFLAQIKKTTADVWGKDVRKTVRYGVNGGIGAGTETGVLPASAGNNYVQFVAPLKNLYGTVEISDKAMRIGQNAEGAFVNILNEEMDGLLKSSSFNLGRMLFGDGSGLLCKITAVDESDNTLYTVDTTRNLAEGMIVDIYTSSGSVTAAGRSINSVDHAAGKIVISGNAISSPAGCSVYIQHSKNVELTGLSAIFSENDLYGVERKGKTWMKPYVKNSAGELTEDMIQTAIDEIEQVSGSRVNFILCSWDVRRKLVSLLSAHLHIDTLNLEGGFKAISFNGIPVVVDRFCPAGTMYLLNTEDFCLHQLCDWQWLEGDNGRIFVQNTNKPTYTATLVKYAELMCYRPAGQGMIAGIGA